MKPRQKRTAMIGVAVISVGVAAGFVLSAFNSNLVFFITPTQVVGGAAPGARAFRIGGLVKDGSVDRSQMTVRFVITDTAREVPVLYQGILPDLFREGKGVVAQGRLDGNGRFIATEVLAKHDENYMPPEARQALAQARHAGSADPALESKP